MRQRELISGRQAAEKVEESEGKETHVDGDDARDNDGDERKGVRGDGELVVGHREGRRGSVLREGDKVSRGRGPSAGETRTHLAAVRVQDGADDRVDDELEALHERDRLLEVGRLAHLSRGGRSAGGREESQRSRGTHLGQEREDGHVLAVTAVGEGGERRRRRRRREEEVRNEKVVEEDEERRGVQDGGGAGGGEWRERTHAKTQLVMAPMASANVRSLLNATQWTGTPFFSRRAGFCVPAPAIVMMQAMTMHEMDATERPRRPLHLRLYERTAETPAMRTAQPMAQLAPESKVAMASLPARMWLAARPIDLKTMATPRMR